MITNSAYVNTDLRDIYQGASMFLLGGGPSLRNEPLHLLEYPGCLVMAMNNAASLFRPHLWVSVDPPENFLLSIWQDPAIMKFMPVSRMKAFPYDSELERNHVRRVQRMPNVWGFKSNLSFNAAKYLTEPSVNFGESEQGEGGRSVMLAAIKLAYYMGIRRIYLAGVDFHMTPEDTYAFPQSKDAAACRANNGTYAKLIRRFIALKPYFQKSGLEVFMCNTQSKLDVFPLLPLDHAVMYEQSIFPTPECEHTDGLYTRRTRRTMASKDKAVRKQTISQQLAERLHARVRKSGETGAKKPVATPAAVTRKTVSQKRARIDPAFFDESAPNPYPQYEDLRRDYFVELEKKGGAECSGCALGALRRTFAYKLSELISK